MPLIDAKCDSCGAVREYYRPLSMWPDTPPCANCDGKTTQVLLPAYMKAGPIDPVVIYQMPDGTFRFPPDINSSSTAMYEQKGGTRLELKGWADVRRFEKHMNESERSDIRRRVERQQEQFEAGESARRSEIRRCLDQGFQIPEHDDRGRPTGRMQRVEPTARLRAILQAAIDRNDRKGGPKAYDAGFHVEAYSQDRSNREADPRRRGQ